MFCYSEICNGVHDYCMAVKDLKDTFLEFKEFKSENEIEMSKEILCLVTSWEEPPYFIVLSRYERGVCNAFNGELLKNTRIIKWAYLPENEL